MNSDRRDFLGAIAAGAAFGALPLSFDARRAFADRLPPGVVNETRTGLQSADWPDALAEARDEMAEELDLIARAPAAAELIDIARMRRLVAEWPDGGWDGAATATAYRSTLLRAIAAGHFLRTVGGG